VIMPMHGPLSVGGYYSWGVQQMEGVHC
jgi:hypothetical protein